MYKITNYSKSRAKELGVVIKPSTNSLKKLDVYKDGRKLASIGAKKYGDYPTFLEKYGKDYADKRRKLYKKRHQRDRLIKNTPGFFADYILW